MKTTIWQKWLIILGIILIILGIIIPILPLLNADLTYITGVFWKDSSMTESAMNFYKWIFGEYSSIYVPFGFFILMLVIFGYKNKDKWVWWSLFTGILIWFILDQVFSIAFGVYLNAVNNCILFILLIIPILFSRKHFFKSK